MPSNEVKNNVNDMVPVSRAYFPEGLSWSEYLAQMKKNREHIEGLYRSARVSPERARAFSTAVQKHGGSVSISVLTENWCGDSISNLPIVARLEEAVPGIRLRIFLGKDHPEVKRFYNEAGIESIPALSFFNSDWRELGRWIERPAEATKLVEEWASRHPELDALKASEADADKIRLKSLYDGLLLEMAAWYSGGLWNETLREILAVLA